MTNQEIEDILYEFTPKVQLVETGEVIVQPMDEEFKRRLKEFIIKNSKKPEGYELREIIRSMK